MFPYFDVQLLPQNCHHLTTRPWCQRYATAGRGHQRHPRFASTFAPSAGRNSEFRRFFFDELSGMEKVRCEMIGYTTRSLKKHMEHTLKTMFFSKPGYNPNLTSMMPRKHIKSMGFKQNVAEVTASGFSSSGKERAPGVQHSFQGNNPR